MSVTSMRMWYPSEFQFCQPVTHAEVNQSKSAPDPLRGMKDELYGSVALPGFSSQMLNLLLLL